MTVNAQILNNHDLVKTVDLVRKELRSLRKALNSENLIKKTPPIVKLYKIKEIHEKTNIPLSTIYRIKDQGILKAFILEGTKTIYVREDDLAKFLDANLRKIETKKKGIEDEI